MRLNLRKTRTFSPLLVAGALLFASCVNDDYDFDQIDSTIGLGSDGLELPASSTAAIQLSDVLELEANGSVVEADNGDYLFRRDGGDVSPAHPFIGRITVEGKSLTASDIYLAVASAKNNRRWHTNSGVELTAQGDVQAFTYEGDAPDEVVELTQATVNSRLTFVVDPTALSQVVSKFDKLTITLPGYMTLANVTVSNGTCKQNGSTIEIDDVKTNSKLTLSASIVAFDFKAADTTHGELTLGNGKVSLTGKIGLSLTASTSNVSLTGALGDKPITSSLTMDNFVITGATGRFNPSINLSNLGEVAVTGVPNFLTDGNVVVDLDNPQIQLTLSNDMNVYGIVDGQIVSHKNGATLATVDVDGLKLNASGTTSICICRKADGISGYDQVVEVPTLSELIRTIPDRISFSATARADADKECSFELGHEYTVKPVYSVYAPIAFAEDANIVYKDSIDDINDDIQDIDFADDSYLSVTADAANGVPANLNLEATPIGLNGQDLSGELEVNVDGEIKASPDGVQTVTSQIKVTVSPKKSGALKKLDRVRFTVTGSAKGADGTAVTGYTLNAKKHTLVVDNIKVKLVGKLIGDFN